MADAVSLPTPPVVINAFSRFKLALSMGLDASLLVWGDSTGDSGNNPREWPYLLADALAAKYPAYSVQVTQWNDTSNIWNSPTLIQTGSGGTPPTITIWNCSVGGTITQYMMGSNWLTSLRSASVDGLIINHGHNHATGHSDAVVRGEFLAAVETFRLYHPNTQISATMQNPRQDSLLMDQIIRMWKDVARCRDIALIDVHSLFVRAGKPTSLYGVADTVHPNAAGQVLWLQAVMSHFSAATAKAGSLTAPALSVKADGDVNFLPNGDFSKYTTSPGAPDSWTAASAGSLTVTKDTSIVCDAKLGYSVKTVVTGNAGRIEYTFSGATLNALKGKTVTLAVRRYLAAGAAVNVGRVQLSATGSASGAITENTRSYATKTDGWVWLVLSGVFLPSDITSLVIRLYADQSASPAGTAAYFDQACLVPGLVPRAAR